MKQRVVSLSDFGPAENMSLIEADIPTPGSGQIIVKNSRNFRPLSEINNHPTYPD